MDVDSYCANIVQAMGKEAGELFYRLSQFLHTFQPHFFQDNVEIEALSRALQLNLDVAYLNGGRGDGVIDFIKFRHDLIPEASPLILLYRYVHFLLCPI
jgi:ubiquitin thioesterase protein OTUB1